jgi:tRNA threonylcarbamoyladenosine biosynthesis protein TsaB
LTETTPEVTSHPLHEPSASRKLLAIDTSLGSVVAVNSEHQVSVAHSADPLGHAEVIGELITTACQEAGVELADISGVVMGVGPGSFTGLRVGMAAAHGFAMGRNVALLPLLSHEAIARAYFQTTGSGRIRVLQDARRKELFVSEWEAAAVPKLVGDVCVMPRNSYEAGDTDVWPTRVPAAYLIESALHRLRDGLPFADPSPMYLRDPDVRRPGAVKRVSR